MKRFSLTLSVFTLILSAVMVIPGNLKNVDASSALAGHAEPSAAEEHHGDDELPGEVPYDRPVQEILKYLEPMNEMDLFPCSDCHDADWEADRTRRDLDEPHNEIPGTFQNHDTDNRWCLDCHALKNRDSLRLLTGKLVQFKEYYRLCEQCHKKVYREWKMGVHGKRTGYWNDGDKQWMHCTQCHNPHNPPFQSIEPEPAPRTPENLWISDKK